MTETRGRIDDVAANLPPTALLPTFGPGTGMSLLRAALSIGLVLLPCATAQAQGARDVPVQPDLQRERRIERKIDRSRPPRSDPFVTPDNPDGVVGFDGPPDPMDDGVDGGGPLPPGSPASPY